MTDSIPVASQFRADFPEFAQRQVYADSAINFWLQVATNLLNPLRWGKTLSLAAELFVAHNLVLEKQALDASRANGTPGVATGPVSGKSVDKVSVNYDAAASMEKDAGHWNLTTYGLRLKRLMDYFGAGPVQITNAPGGDAAFNAIWQPGYWRG